MDGPHMFGGQGRAPNEDDDHGGGAFRGDDGVGGDTLAMGMDVDIPAATTAGDRREAERRRGREGRCSTKPFLAQRPDRLHSCMHHGGRNLDSYSMALHYCSHVVAFLCVRFMHLADQ